MNESLRVPLMGRGSPHSLSLRGGGKISTRYESAITKKKQNKTKQNKTYEEVLFLFLFFSAKRVNSTPTSSSFTFQRYAVNVQ